MPFSGPPFSRSSLLGSLLLFRWVAPFGVFVGWSVVGCSFFLSLSVGCSRGFFFFFFCVLSFSLSSFCCVLVSPCRGVSPRLVCVFSFCSCLGLWLLGSAVVSRGSCGSCSCVCAGCFSPCCSCVGCACVPRRPFWLGRFSLVLCGGSCFCSRSCCVSPSCFLPALALPFGFVGWGFGCPRGRLVFLPSKRPRGLPLLAPSGRVALNSCS